VREPPDEVKRRRQRRQKELAPYRLWATYKRSLGRPTEPAKAASTSTPVPTQPPVRMIALELVSAPGVSSVLTLCGPTERERRRGVRPGSVNGRVWTRRCVRCDGNTMMHRWRMRAPSLFTRAMSCLHVWCRVCRGGASPGGRRRIADMLGRAPHLVEVDDTVTYKTLQRLGYKDESPQQHRDRAGAAAATRTAPPLTSVPEVKDGAVRDCVDAIVHAFQWFWDDDPGAAKRHLRLLQMPRTTLDRSYDLCGVVMQWCGDVVWCWGWSWGWCL